MEVPILRTITVLLLPLHRISTLLRRDQWAEEVPSRARPSAPEGCFSMQTDRRGFLPKTDRIATGENRTRSPRTANCGGESSSLRPPLPLRLPPRQAAEAAWPEDPASTITLATSRDTTVTTETTTITITPPARSTPTRPRTRRRRTPLRRDASGGEGNAAPLETQPVDPRRGGPSPGSAPTTPPPGRHSTSTPW